MKVVPLEDLYKCETCYHHRSGKCSPKVWCDHGEQYRPDSLKLRIIDVEVPSIWKLTDACEMGYEYECLFCHRHIGVRIKGKDLPSKCPYCGAREGDQK